ncbi:MAG: hypothetical protein HS113_02475 [Verrucomicrobiales bacterium]|nr:hypothetical protein [Verrucomicrobiales bacterium]
MAVPQGGRLPPISGARHEPSVAPPPNSFLTVKTAKTGETADTPGFPTLREKPERTWSVTGDWLQAERENGRRRASVRDFHSFRVTWITLALAAGVPLELVQRVTGNRTVEVVMKGYFRPGREDFRAAILKAMPKMLADGGEQRSVKEEMREMVNITEPKSVAISCLWA